MIKILPLLFAAALLYATPISAGGAAGGVPDGSYWSFGADMVKIDVIQDPNRPNGAVTQATGAGGISGAANGTQGTNSTPAVPTASSAGIMTLPNGDQVCIEGSTPWRRHPGKPWKPGRKVKQPKVKGNNKKPRAGNVFGSASSPGDDVVALPWP